MIVSDYHRNGSAGVGFYVSTDGTVVVIEFVQSYKPIDDGERAGSGLSVVPPISAHVPTLAAMQPGIARRVIGGYAYRFDHREHGPMVLLISGRYVESTMTHPGRLDMETAVLQLDMLSQGDIRFGRNSWRGDVLFGERAAEVLEACAGAS